MTDDNEREGDLLDDDNDEENADDGEEEEEEDAPEYTETKFKFEDFIKRLVNPRVVRACVIMLSDWEKISTRALKSVVTILHRIAFGCKMPAMLFQASLFRIFQNVLKIEKEAHNEELRKLAIYIVRQFVLMAPKNPKIYAELLFYKTIREANDIEFNYEDHDIGAKNSWNEEEENELRELFMENQRNPQTDEDVIDWITNNLSNKSRKRRGVIKKLKELDLIFKAPTKKSLAAAAAKFQWNAEKDSLLRQLYDDNRLNPKPLKKIMEALEANGEKRRKPSVIKRMIELGLIADKSEIQPTKTKRIPTNKSNKGKNPNDSDNENDSNHSNSDSDNDSEKEVDFDELRRKNDYNKRKTDGGKKRKLSSLKKAPPKKQRKPMVPLDLHKVKSLIHDLSETMSTVLSWLQESFDDATEDYDDSVDDPDDAVPIVPITDEQTEAMENETFILLLKELGLNEPIKETETYWKIPIHLTISDLKTRSQLLTGLYDESALDLHDKLIVSDNEDDDEDSDEEEGDNFNANNKHSLFDRKKRIVYNDSDNDEEQIQINRPRSSVKKSSNEKKEKKKSGPGRLNNSDESNDIRENDEVEFDINSQVLRKRFEEIIDSDDDDVVVQRADITKLRNINVNDNSDDDDNVIVVNDKRKKITTLIDSDSEEDADNSKTKHNKSNSSRNKINVIEDDDEDDNENETDLTSSNIMKNNVGNRKRERSLDNVVEIDNEDNSMDVNEINVRKKAKKIRKISSSEDEE